MSTLLAQFLSQECTVHVRQLLERAIDDASVPPPSFELNRFEITVDRDTGLVILADVLEATEVGVQHVPLEEFMKALERRSA